MQSLESKNQIASILVRAEKKNTVRGEEPHTIRSHELKDEFWKVLNSALKSSEKMELNKTTDVNAICLESSQRRSKTKTYVDLIATQNPQQFGINTAHLGGKPRYS